MPIVPAHAALDIPPSVARDDMVWAETLAPGGYSAKLVARGTRIELTDLEGDGCVSMLAFNREFPVERLNVADTMKIQWNAYLGAGRFILSDMGRVILSILEDTAGTHDGFCGASSAASNARRYGAGGNYGPHPSARDRFRLATAKFGLGRKDIHPCLNFFKGVTIGEDGATNVHVGPFEKGRKLQLRAEMDLILVLANCPHVLDPRERYCVTPVRIRGWRGPIPTEDDAVRNATPEGQRAFLNTQDYYDR